MPNVVPDTGCCFEINQKGDWATASGYSEYFPAFLETIKPSHYEKVLSE
jgi:hypothetical protein